ncbi:hypothetical protein CHINAEXTREME_10540 [Halobiforma lacisalsi AJ5]|uniref:DUF4330 domain-containing protein n=1 Tax=Natronobacterium lacisalsi AJ5 TaxID=358396 RepID=A0A1P8LQY2_NATLA|nr:DUF4330 family protein [Halobiforma lacisalsi]APW98199.1 hypothetical protein CHINAEXTREME_10540 [Halobiforma lacisalsi AJ5]
MPLIDEEGNLFGVVNVIDALVVLLVLAVVVAGVAVVGVLGSDEDQEPDSDVEPVEQPETKYLTLDLGHQPDYIAERVEAGDSFAVTDEESNVDGTFSITDVHVTSTVDDERNAHVVVRAEVTGDYPRIGTDLRIETDEYVAQGKVTALDDDGTSLETTTTPVLLETTVSERTATGITEGDTVTFGNHTAATVTNVRLYPVGPDQYRVLVGADLHTHSRASAPTYAGAPVSTGTQFTLPFDGYELVAEVVDPATDELPGEPSTATADVELEDVPPEIADGLEAGLTESIRGETLATVQSVDRRDEGNVTLTVELQTRETETGLQFHGESIRDGDRIILDFETTLIEGTVTRLD